MVWNLQVVRQHAPHAPVIRLLLHIGLGSVKESTERLVVVVVASALLICFLLRHYGTIFHS